VKWIGRDGQTVEFGITADVCNWTGLVLSAPQNSRVGMFYMLGSSGDIQHYSLEGWEVVK